MNTEICEQEFVKNLVDLKNKITMKDFFKIIHNKFYPKQDISFMEYFLELSNHKGKFIVHHNKLIEYGIMSSVRSSAVKERLDVLGLVEGKEYRLTDVREPVKQGGYSSKKVYMLTPESFKKCLMRAQRRKEQTVDPVVYCDYYLLLETTYNLYTYYEKEILSRQLEENKLQLEENKTQLEENKSQIEEKDRLVLRLNEMLIDSTKLPKTQVVYIATSQNYAQQNRFKVGGVESLDKLSSRLSVYNGRSANGDSFYFSDWFLVHNFSQIESRLKSLMGRFRENPSKEIYIIHYSKIQYILQYLIEHYNDETDTVNYHLSEFISSLNINNLRPVVPKAQCLKKIKISEVGLTSNTSELVLKLKNHIKTLDKETKIIYAKDVFDKIGLKSERRKNYPILEEVIKNILSNAKMLKF
jgi:hypothetical protein